MLYLQTLNLLYIAEPSQAPVLTAVTVLNSTSIQVEWKQVPKEYRHGIITKYVILYKDEKGEDNGERTYPHLL